MNKTQKILTLGIILLCVFEVGLIYSIFTIPQVEIMYVTTVSFSEILGATSVYSYDHSLVFKGIHEDIEPGITYKFTYIGSLPWSKLISLDIHNKEDSQ